MGLFVFVIAQPLVAHLFLAHLLLAQTASLTQADVFARLLAVVTLIGLNAFFVTVEFSIVSVRRSRINHLVSVGDTQAKTVQKLQRQLSSLLSTTQLGITYLAWR